MLSLGMDGIPVSPQWESGDVEDPKTPLFDFGTDIAGGKHRNAQARDHGLLDGFAAAELHVGLDFRSFASKRLIDRRSRSGTGLPAQEPLLKQRPQREVPPAGKRMCRPAYDDQRVV